MVGREPTSRKPESQIQEATESYQQAVDEPWRTKKELQRRQSGIVPTRDIEKLQVVCMGGRPRSRTARSTKQNAEGGGVGHPSAGPEGQRRRPRWPRRKSSWDKTIIRAGVDGRVEQFTLRPGDIGHPIMPFGGLLIPRAPAASPASRLRQIEAQIMKAGMIAEVTCVSKPFTVIPMVVTGRCRTTSRRPIPGGEQLIDPQQVTRPGTLLAVSRAALCRRDRRRNAAAAASQTPYSSNHDIIVARNRNR